MPRKISVPGRQPGRPRKFDKQRFSLLLLMGYTMSEISREMGMDNSTAYRYLYWLRLEAAKEYQQIVMPD